MLALAEPDHQRGPEARAHERLRLVLVQEHERVDPLELADRLPDRILERAAVVVGHQVRHHLGVGLRHETVARGLEACLQAR